MKPVHEAWADVMADLAGLAKRDRNTHQNFNFRGVDAVMNAVGPVLRAHRVAVFPVAVTYDREQVTTSKGSAMTSTVANVAYEIVGPDGSTMPAQAAGEAFDSGDKSMPKAMSVAYRTLLLQALCLPTDEPDPDSHSYERAAPTSQPEPQGGDAGPTCTECGGSLVGASVQKNDDGFAHKGGCP